jgi:hypothetical protein
VRTHRIWERYLADRTGVASGEWHAVADRLEHGPADEVDRPPRAWAIRCTTLTGIPFRPPPARFPLPAAFRCPASPSGPPPVSCTSRTSPTRCTGRSSPLASARDAACGSSVSTPPVST